MNEKYVRKALNQQLGDPVVPLVTLPTFTKDAEIRVRCYKLANEILAREKGEVKRLG
jgi:hypothetical protein